MTARPTTSTAFGTSGRPARRRRDPARAAGRAGRLDAVLRLRPATAHRAGRPSCARPCPARLNLGYAVKANPMPAVVQHLAGLVDSLDVASAGEMQVALDTGMPADQVSFAGPGKTDGRDPPGGRRRCDHRDGVARRGPRGWSRLGERARAAAAGRGPGQSRLRGQGLGHADGRRAAAVRRRRRAGAGAAGRPGRGLDLDFARLPRLRRLAEPAAPRSSPRPSAGPSIWCSQLADKAARRRSATSTSAAGSASRTSTRTSPSTWPGSADNLATCSRRRASAERCPRPASVIELGRYIVGECRRLRHPRRRPQGLARSDLPGRRRRHAPPARRVRQLRPGHPAQLPDRRSAPGSTTPARTESATVVGCLCTPLDLLGDKVALPEADVGDLVVLFQAGAYGLTASPTASSATRPRPRCSSDHRRHERTRSVHGDQQRHRSSEVIDVRRHDARHRGPRADLRRLDPAVRRAARARLAGASSSSSRRSRSGSASSIDDEEFTGEIFETVGTLADFVAQKSA